MSRQEPGTTQLGLAPQGLLSLVDELLLNIIDQIDAQEGLRNLAATCARFQALVEPYIWRKLLVLQGMHARGIAAALDGTEARADYVRDLSIRYQDDYREGIENLNHHIGLMSKLRHLTLESPCPNNSEWRNGVAFDGWSRIDFSNLLAAAVYPRLGVPLALPMLQSLNLHAHGAGDRKFVLGRAVSMFRHPTLRRITLSCLNFNADMPLGHSFKDKEKYTPLQSLTLIECNVNVPFLDVILSLPTALKELSIGERLHTFDECRPDMNRETRTSSALFLSALQRQAHSLERLVHIGGQVSRLATLEPDPDGAAKLRSFTRLEHLEVGFESILLFYLRKNGFPPSLQTLKYLDAALSQNFGHDLQSLSDVAFRSLTSLVTDHLPIHLPPGFVLHLKFADHSFFRFFFRNDVVDPAEQNHMLSTFFLDRPAMYKIATIMKSYNARFLVSREVFPSGVSYIPPYMYGEDLPVEDPMYNSDDYWRFNGINYQAIDDPQLRSELREKKGLFLCKPCKKRGFTVDGCLNFGDGSACWTCREVRSECVYERDGNGAMVADGERPSKMEAV